MLLFDNENQNTNIINYLFKICKEIAINLIKADQDEKNLDVAILNYFLFTIKIAAEKPYHLQIFYSVLQRIMLCFQFKFWQCINVFDSAISTGNEFYCLFPST